MNQTGSSEESRIVAGLENADIHIHAETAKSLLIWARDQKIQVSAIAVGEVSLGVHDLGLAAAEQAVGKDRDREPDEGTVDDTMVGRWSGPLGMTPPGVEGED